MVEDDVDVIKELVDDNQYGREEHGNSGLWDWLVCQRKVCKATCRVSADLQKTIEFHDNLVLQTKLDYLKHKTMWLEQWVFISAKLSGLDG